MSACVATDDIPNSKLLVEFRSVSDLSFSVNDSWIPRQDLMVMQEKYTNFLEKILASTPQFNLGKKKWIQFLKH
jgi:hypothetical protein